MGGMGDFRASEKDIRLTVYSALLALLEEQNSGRNFVIKHYEALKKLRWAQWNDEIREEAENDHAMTLHGYMARLKELEETHQKVTLALDGNSLTEARKALIAGESLPTIYDGLRSLKEKIESKTSLNDLDMQAVIDRFDKFRQGADDYANVVEWLKIVAVDKWLSGELDLHEQIQETYVVQKTLDWHEGLEKAQPAEPKTEETPPNTVDLTMYSKKYVFENSGALIFKDDFARRTDTIDSAVKAFREKYKENAGITIEEIDNKYSAQGGWGVAEFEQEVKLHIGSVILAVKSTLDDLRGTFISNGIDADFIGKIRNNLEEDLDIPGEKEDAVKYYLALKEAQEWLDRDFCVHEVKQSTESDVTLPMVEKQKAKEAIEMVGVYVINKHEISWNLLLAIREFIEKRKTENQPIRTNRECLTGISGESWSHVFTEFKEKIDNASAFDLNALDLWGPIIKKAGYSTTDELFNQHATLINLFEFAVEEKMNEIRNQRNLTVEYIKQNTEKKTYGLEYDIAVDSFLALKAANDWLTELMRKKEEGPNTIESEKAVKQQLTIQTSNKNEANHPSSSINQKRIPDYKKNRSWTQFVHNKNILKEFEQICDKEGCTTKKQIVDEFWIVYGNELDGKKSGLYDACCNNEKANKFLEQVISEHKKAK